MSILSEIKDLHFVLKYMLVNIGLTAPLFYIDMYFLNNNLFNTAPLYIPIVSAFCMSICWYYATTSIIVIGSLSSPKTINKDYTDQVHFTSTMVSVSTIAILSTICLYFRFTFRNFFHLCFFTIVLGFIIAIFSLLTTKSNKS
jgi:hypothetical protein